MAQVMPIREINTVAVIGCTGRQGCATVKALSESNQFSKICGISRDANKGNAQELCKCKNVTVISANLDNKESLTRSLQNTDGVFLMTPISENEAQFGRNVIDACKTNNVSFIVYSSVGNADKNSHIPHFQPKLHIENYLKGSGLSYFIIRPTFFMENFAQKRDDLLSKGGLSLPLPGNKKLQLVSTTDIGRLACTAFQNPTNFSGHTLEFALDEKDMNTITQNISQKLNVQLKYTQQNLDEYKQQNPAMGVMYEWLSNYGYTASIDECRRYLPDGLTFEKWLQESPLFRLA